MIQTNQEANMTDLKKLKETSPGFKAHLEDIKARGERFKRNQANISLRNTQRMQKMASAHNSQHGYFAL